MGLHIATLENAQGVGKKKSFSIDGTEIQEPQLGIENQDLTIEIQTENGNPTVTKILIIWSKIENEVDPISTKISTIGFKIKIELPTKTKLLTKNLCSTRIFSLAKIMKSVNIGEISDLKYPIVDFPAAESVVDGK
jgi:hypothetical protein